MFHVGASCFSPFPLPFHYRIDQQKGKHYPRKSRRPCTRGLMSVYPQVRPLQATHNDTLVWIFNGCMQVAGCTQRAYGKHLSFLWCALYHYALPPPHVVYTCTLRGGYRRGICCMKHESQNIYIWGWGTSHYLPHYPNSKYVDGAMILLTNQITAFVTSTV